MALVDVTTLLGGPLQRGTAAWEARELARRLNGCRCISTGDVPADQLSVRLDMRSLPRWREARARQWRLMNPRGRPKEVEYDGDDEGKGADGYGTEEQARRRAGEV